jgi:hypothetical protein
MRSQFGAWHARERCDRAELAALARVAGAFIRALFRGNPAAPSTQPSKGMAPGKRARGEQGDGDDAAGVTNAQLMSKLRAMRREMRREMPATLAN